MTASKIGIIGCGNISGAYLRGAARSEFIEIKAVADLMAEVAQAKAQEFGVGAASIEEMLADPEISIVINLTVPLAHAEVSRRILKAGKHVYSEKPLAATFEDAKSIIDLAAERGLRVGCAPDTFMGGAHQAARRVIDEGRIGRVVAGAACVLNHGMEGWHPNPEFFFKPGGGPILDLGPYYITQLVNLLGPVESVTAQTTRGFATRTVTSEPLKGTVIDVEVSTTVNGALLFENGANIALSASWDVWKHERRPFEIYGTEGSMLVPDPNFFGGDIQISDGGGFWRPVDIFTHPFGRPNMESGSGAKVANYRAIGLIDMACAIQQNRPHRASGELALHVLEVMDAFDKSSASGTHKAMSTSCTQPAPVPLGEDERVFGRG